MLRPFRCPLLLTIAAILSLATPGPVAAEQIVAAIVTGDLPRYRQAHESLVTVIRKGGFDESKLTIFAQTPNADTMSLTNAIRRSVAAGAALVVSYGTTATLVAAEEVKDAPVLFADVYDPVELGVVQNLAAPGVNRSGAACTLPQQPLLENLMKIAPGVKTIGVMYTAGEAGSQRQLEDLSAAAKALGLYVVAENAANAGKVSGTLQALAEKSDALFLTESVVVTQQAGEIIKAALGRQLPVLSQTPGLEKLGAVLGMYADLAEQGKQVAVHALQVLAGQKAFILPVRQPKQATLAVNLKSAAALGLDIPQTLQDAAAQVVR